MWEKFWTFMKHNRGAALGLTLAMGWLMVVMVMQGCLTTESVLNPGTKASPDDIQREAITVAGYVKGLEAAEADLEAQAETIEKIKALGGGLANAAMAGTLDPATAINTILTGVGLFSITDNVRRRKKIKDLLA